MSIRNSFTKLFSSSSSSSPRPVLSIEQEEESKANNPTETWDKMKGKQRVEKVEAIPHDTPRKEGHLRFVCISDTHSLTNGLTLPPGDVLLHAGDFTNVGTPSDVQGFVDFLNSLDYKHKIIIAGNHDLSFDKASYPETWKRFGHKEMHDADAIRNLLIDAPNVIYLEDSSTTLHGINIYGSPWQPWFYDWAFNLPRGKACREVWEKIPEGTDILITHGPPLGHGDLCSSGDRAGCYDLLNIIQKKIRPKYHVFGHIHEGYGITTDGVTQFINPSTCNLRYRPIQPPVIFDFPIKEEE